MAPSKKDPTSEEAPRAPPLPDRSAVISQSDPTTTTAPISANHVKAMRGSHFGAA